MRRPITPSDTASEFSSLEDFGTRALGAKGRLSIVSGGLPIHLFNEDLGHSATLVTFNGAVGDSVRELPAWIGWGVTRNVAANRILTSDPSLILSQELKLGWYAGNTMQPTLQDDLGAILAALIGLRTPIFYGHSGGAFTALLYGARFPGSIVIAVNPQTRLGAYHPSEVQRYKDHAWDGTLWPGNVIDNVLPLWAEKVDSTLIYIQNSQDTFHVDGHLAPFLEAVHPENRVHVVQPALGEGHVGPNKDSYVALFDAVVANTHVEPDALFAAVDALELSGK